MDFEQSHSNRLTRLGGFNKDGNFVPVDITDDVYQHILSLLCPDGHKEHPILKDINVTRIDNAIIITSKINEKEWEFNNNDILSFGIGGN